MKLFRAEAKPHSLSFTMQLYRGPFVQGLYLPGILGSTGRLLFPLGLGPQKELGSLSVPWVPLMFAPLSLLVCSLLCVTWRPYLIAGIQHFPRSTRAAKTV